MESNNNNNKNINEVIDITGTSDLLEFSSLGGSQQIIRKGALQRTPPRLQGSLNERREKAASLKKSGENISRTPKEGTLITTTLERCFSSPSLGRNKADSKEITLIKLGRKIEDLAEFVKPRLNVHSEIKRMITVICTLYDSAMSKMELSEKECQTSPIGKEMTEIPDMKEVEKGDKENSPIAESNKRKLITPSKSDERSRWKRRNTKDTLQNIPQNNLQGPQTSERELNKEKENEDTDQTDEWRKVEPKRRTKKRIRYSRPDALLIKAKTDISYADILRKVKLDPDLTSLGEKVKHIRKTTQGSLLLELQNTGDQKTTLEYQAKLEGVIGQEADIRSLTHEVMIEIKDIDEITTVDEVREALEKKFEGAKGKFVVKKLTAAYRGTQVAVVSLPSSLMGKVITEGKIRIGWVSCTMRQKIVPKKCFKCLHYGHVAQRCSSQVDRSKLCYKCGEEGHIAKACKKEPRCMVCLEKEDHIGNAKHVTGNFKCPIYKKELQKTRRL